VVRALAWSPDHASCVTVRSQGLSLIEKNSIEIGETYGHVPRSVRRPARTRAVNAL